MDNWDDRIYEWLDEYEEQFPDDRLLEVFLGTAVYWFDQHDAHERVVVAYGLSTIPEARRDANRMRAFPDVNVGVRRVMGAGSFAADRGHFLSHASGGELDINLFPHTTDLNRGRSPEGRVFRRMERLVAKQEGTFHFHRPLYNDDTWIPDRLQYGFLKDDSQWWVELFSNK